MQTKKIMHGSFKQVTWMDLLIENILRQKWKRGYLKLLDLLQQKAAYNYLKKDLILLIF